MKLKLIILIFAIVGLSLASCGEEDAVTPKPGPNPPIIEDGAGDGKAILLKEVIYNIDGIEHIAFKYKYDSKNRLIAQEDLSRPDLLEFGYDSQNRLSTKTHYYNGESNVTTYNYSSDGKTVTVDKHNDQDFIATYTLDDNNRVVAYIETYIEHLDFSLRYHYDIKGRISYVERQNPDGDFVLYDYDYDYDNMNNPFKNLSVQQLLFNVDVGLPGGYTFINNIEYYTGGGSSYEKVDYIEYSPAGFPVKLNYTSYDDDHGEYVMPFIYKYYNE